MSCPFLREGRAQYCNAAPVRKLILDGPGATAGGRCTSPAYRECALVADHGECGGQCPHLEQIHVQYCGASPVTPLVPFSESTLSRCAGAGYRYCETYLALARPHKHTEPPPDLMFAPNHLWLSVSEEGLCHIGLDAFIANVAQRIDRLTFVTSGGTRRPTVALQVNGVEWPVTFPNPLLIQSTNTHLQIHPQRITEDPYGSGWLFEGWEVPDRTRTGLIAGARAHAWMAEERQRLSRFVNDSEQLCGDGGEAAPGVAHLLPRAGVVALFQNFFGRTSWSVEE
jgi:glycine cleavage system H lipoate-binding protein